MTNSGNKIIRGFFYVQFFLMDYSQIAVRVLRRHFQRNLFIFLNTESRIGALLAGRTRRKFSKLSFVVQHQQVTKPNLGGFQKLLYAFVDHSCGKGLGQRETFCLFSFGCPVNLAA